MTFEASTQCIIDVVCYLLVYGRVTGTRRWHSNKCIAHSISFFQSLKLSPWTPSISRDIRVFHRLPSKHTEVLSSRWKLKKTQHCDARNSALPCASCSKFVSVWFMGCTTFSTQPWSLSTRWLMPVSYTASLTLGSKSRTLCSTLAMTGTALLAIFSDIALPPDWCNTSLQAMTASYRVPANSPLTSHFVGRDRAFGIAFATDRTVRGSNPQIESNRIESMRLSAPVQTGPGTHTASYIMGTGGKAAGTWRWPPIRI